MSPAFYLFLVVGLTLGAFIAERVGVWRHRKKMRQLASQWEMHYTPDDRLRLMKRVTTHFPIPGAANLYVTDVIFRTDGGRGTDSGLHRYLFTVEYFVGVIHSKHREQRVVGTAEPVHGGPHELHLQLAPPHLPLAKQYEFVRDRTISH